MYRAEVTIKLKKGMLNPEASTTKRALEHLGFEIDDLETAEVFYLNLEADSREDARGQVDEMCQRLLANPVIHDYTISVSEV